MDYDLHLQRSVGVAKGHAGAKGSTGATGASPQGSKGHAGATGAKGATDDTQLPRVKVYKAVVGKKQDGEIAALKDKIRRNPKTLFVCIQDECHFGLTAKGMHRFYHRKQ